MNNDLYGNTSKDTTCYVCTGNDWSSPFAEGVTKASQHIENGYKRIVEKLKVRL